MSKILVVAGREFVETVKNKIFIINLILVPVLVIGGMVLSVHFTKKAVEGPRESKQIVIEDLSGQLADDLKQAFEKNNKNTPQRQTVLTLAESKSGSTTTGTHELADRVRENKIHGYIVLAKEAVEGQGKSYYYMKARNIADMELFSTVQQMINNAVVAVRSRRHNLSPETLNEIHRWVALEQRDVSTKTQEKRNEVAMMMVPFFFLFLMFTGVFAVNQQILTSVIEEKNSRIMEVILSAISPFQLMTGKMLGAVGGGFILVGVWGGAGYAATQIKGINAEIPMSTLVYFTIYFILGFLMVASLLAALGSICNTMKEAQSMMMPAMIIFIIPMISWFFIVQHPNGLLAIVFSFIPPITPMVMILRIAAWPEIPFWQIAASFALLAASVPLTLWLASRIFRIGILMYGKPPSLREIVRWVRYS